jgi:hypothetical protein
MEQPRSDAEEAEATAPDGRERPPAHRRIGPRLVAAAVVVVVLLLVVVAAAT